MPSQETLDDSKRILLDIRILIEHQTLFLKMITAIVICKIIHIYKTEKKYITIRIF
ncbi:hypothetical protein JOC94_004266 [Bacillus thermophilus]|uniref:Uncharacterized protein n=1 Tax=Siminovitchia thermophila TaxID=1245522 RepID=A0ABS2RF75_9BACI|nr:hypothetical protein [Siminovitchia thermophila]MBM7717241.1 hypothetical protein [Siminovitchia thermophila]